MLPGVNLDALPSFVKGQLCSVSVPGNPAPFAVRQHGRNHLCKLRLVNVGKSHCANAGSRCMHALLTSFPCIRKDGSFSEHATPAVCR